MNLTRTQQANVEFHRFLANRYREQPFFQQENRRRVCGLLREFAREAGSERLLDVGCGTGFILDLAHDLFDQLDGLDLTPEMLDQVTRRDNLTLTLSEAEKMPFADESFNVVTCYSVLHHIEDLASVFAEVRRVLKPGGVFYADESPSCCYRGALKELAAQGSAGAFIQQEIESVRSDAEKYKQKYGIANEITQKAMVQVYGSSQFTPEHIEEMLNAAGFAEVRIEYRRIAGQRTILAKYGPDCLQSIEQYLRGMLPTSKQFFKYFVVVAR
jgi:ubiquinone/menaquinone biosynthesis C-methylase UbiE